MTLCNFILSDIVCEKGKEASDILSRFDTLSRAFSNRRVFDENAQRISFWRSLVLFWRDLFRLLVPC